MVLALVAIEQCDDLDEIVTVSSRNISKLPPGSIHEDMKEQEKISMRDLLYCVALHQANDACIAIAEHIAQAADGRYDELLLTHADCMEDIELLKEEILKIAPFKKVTISTIGPIVGASVGPGTVIAFCHGKEVLIEGNE